ncbi:hypothetical protein HRbin36_02654 [bacterium HR36]|nr:hypothetical protein HRbin36_02654 [bacterium HR36]
MVGGLVVAFEDLHMAAGFGRRLRRKVFEHLHGN